MKAADFRVLLQDELAKRCQNNPAYSLRAYAKLLKTDAGTLSKILNKKRPLGRISIEKFSRQLGLDPIEARKYMTPKKLNQTDSVNRETFEYQELTLDQFNLIAEWQHFAILEVMRLNDFRPSSAWIAKRLGISIHEVNAAIDRLVRLKLLEINGKGEWLDLSEGRTTTVHHAFTTTALKRLQRAYLEQAALALDLVDIVFRDQSTMTMAVDVDKIQLAKDEIRKFRRRMAKLLSRTSKCDEVYNLCISLFPLTQKRPLKSPPLTPLNERKPKP